jgi:hypothetical protein
VKADIRGVKPNGDLLRSLRYGFRNKLCAATCARARARPCSRQL